MAPSPGGTDERQLRDLGYRPEFERSMSLWENFSLGFTYLSPVVGGYSVFALSIQAAGPPMVWSYVLAGIGQFLVCLVFSEIVAQYPIAGGLYPWCRRLAGERWGWMSGWIYAWALFTTIAAVALGAGPFLADFLGLPASPRATALVALVLVASATALNLLGTRWLARVALFGFVCELVGALVVGVYLLAFHRHNPIGTLVDTQGVRVGGAYWPAFLAGATAGLFCCYGFEACADVAEETPDPGRRIPRAMRMTIYIGIAAAIFVCVALLLALPDLRAAVSGDDPNPIATVLRLRLGDTGSRAVIAVVMVSFFSCVLSLQAATSRLLFAFGRDGMIAGGAALTRVSAAGRVPWVALLVAGAVPASIVLLGLFLQDAIATVIGFATAGIYLAFQMVVVAALFARARGWRPAGSFRLGAWGWPVNIAALAWGCGGLLDMVWPRAPDQPWYVDAGMIVTLVGVCCTGLIVMTLQRKAGGQRTMQHLAVGFGALLLACGAARAQTAPDTAALLAPVKMLIEALNHAAPVCPAVFTDDATTLDDFPPYRWSGRGGGCKWYSALVGTDAKSRAEYVAQHASLTVGDPQFVRGPKDTAYLVLPGTFLFDDNGTRTRQTATWLVTEKRAADGWRIAGTAWAITAEAPAR